MTRLIDVANAAEVSLSTASRVMNGSDYPVRPDVRNKILLAADMLGYENAKSRQSKKTMDIGVLIPNITNPFYPQMILGIESVALDYSSNIFVCSTLRNRDREQQYLKLLYEKKVEGVIISSVDKKAEYLSKYIQKGMKFVLLDQKIDNANCPYINYNPYDGARKAVKTLLDYGHRDTVFITTPLTRWTRQEVFRGFREELESSGVSFNSEMVFELREEKEGVNEGYELSAGQALCKMYLKSKVKATAALCVNDMVAFGFMQEIQRSGLKIPDDISVIGFDDIPMSSLVYPPLTTVRQNTYECGRLAAKMLFEQVLDKEDYSFTVSLEPQIMIRESIRRI